MYEVRLETPSTPFELRHASTDRPVLVVVPERRLLVIDGAGYPGAADFRAATTVLRTVEAGVRAAMHRDWLVAGPKSIMEIAWLTDEQWTLDDLIRAFEGHQTVHWRQMIEVPRGVATTAVNEAIQATGTTAGREIPLVRLIAFTEGRAAQLLHLGGMANLPTTVARLSMFAAESGFLSRGALHQLVFADSDVVPRERARSILRLPMEAATALPLPLSSQ
jgi:hypothetical protein